jgi:Zn-dependent peptidase ImmA (M78 family)
MRHILEAAQSVRDEFGGKNIFETAENSGVAVWFRELGSLKGFYLCESGKRYIVINDALDNTLKTVVCAHEFGHDMLHRELSGGGIRDNTLFLDGNKTEREANLFAADMLISDKQILSELRFCGKLDVLAYELGYPAEIVEYKLEILNYKGYHFNVEPVKSDFLK